MRTLLKLSEEPAEADSPGDLGVFSLPRALRFHRGLLKPLMMHPLELPKEPRPEVCGLKALPPCQMSIRLLGGVNLPGDPPPPLPGKMMPLLPDHLNQQGA